MTSNFTRASIAILVNDLQCRCGAMNSHTVHTIHIDDNGRMAACDQCGLYAPLVAFIVPIHPKEQ